MERPTTPVKRTGEPTEMYADGTIVTYYTDQQATRWACAVAYDGLAKWYRAPKEGAK